MRVWKGTIAVLLAACWLVLAGTVSVAAAKPTWQKAPVIPALNAKQKVQLQERVERGLKAGLRQNVFAKIGDSNTEFPANLYGLACRPSPALPAGLLGTLRRYNRTRLPNPQALPGCRPWTSFSRHSVAAQAGVFTSWAVTPVKDLPETGYLRRPIGCEDEQTPLSCELAATRPRYALVMIGSNDLRLDIGVGLIPGSQALARLSEVIAPLLQARVVPILSTIPPVISSSPQEQKKLTAGIRRTNAAVWQLARARNLPMINLWRALKAPAVINQGLTSGGLHLSVPGADEEINQVTPVGSVFADSVDFSLEGLRYGANRRNLIWLATLARLDRSLPK